MKIRVEFLLIDSASAAVYDVSRVPCIGEFVAYGFSGMYYEVRSVIHILNADPETEVQAVVRVAGKW